MKVTITHGMEIYTFKSLGHAATYINFSNQNQSFYSKIEMVGGFFTILARDEDGDVTEIGDLYGNSICKSFDDSFTIFSSYEENNHLTTVSSKTFEIDLEEITLLKMELRSLKGSPQDNREEGFYWVKSTERQREFGDDSPWYIAFWNGEWFLREWHREEGEDDNYWDEIDESRIVRQE